MRNLMLLDCTLRDGGYINDWEFGHDTLTNVFERLVSTKVDVIEIGFWIKGVPMISIAAFFRIQRPYPKHSGELIRETL